MAAAARIRSLQSDSHKNDVVLASGNLKVNVVSNEADLTVVEISNFKMSNFEIEVTDEYGEYLYEMKTKAPVNEFKKRYDFSGLEDGIYWYSVKIDKEKITKKLEIENGKVDVLEISKVVEPFFVQHDDLLKFSILNFQQEDVKLFVYGPDNKCQHARPSTWSNLHGGSFPY